MRGDRSRLAAGVGPGRGLQLQRGASCAERDFRRLGPLHRWPGRAGRGRSLVFTRSSPILRRSRSARRRGWISACSRWASCCRSSRWARHERGRRCRHPRARHHPRLAGPLCTMVLGDLGADVDQGRAARGGRRDPLLGPAVRRRCRPDADRLQPQQALRRARPAHPEGRRPVWRWRERSDVFVENFRPGTARRFGLDYAARRAVRPDIVYCSISGYGQTGPMAPRPAVDLMVQALGGLMAQTGEPDGPPVEGRGPRRRRDGRALRRDRHHGRADGTRPHRQGPLPRHQHARRPDGADGPVHRRLGHDAAQRRAVGATGIR